MMGEGAFGERDRAMDLRLGLEPRISHRPPLSPLTPLAPRVERGVMGDRRSGEEGIAGGEREEI